MFARNLPSVADTTAMRPSCPVSDQRWGDELQRERTRNLAQTLLQGMGWLSNALDSLTEHCICGIEVNREHIAATSARNIGLATALAPVISYTAAARIARTSLANGRGIADIVRSEGLLAEELLTALLRPESMTSVAEVEPQD